MNPADEQRAHLIGLLCTLNAAVRFAPQAQEIYPDNGAAALGYMIGAWAPVATAYTELTGTVSEVSV